MTLQGKSLADTIQNLSDRLVQIQRPIRILNAVRWPDAVEERFVAAGGTELPRVDRDTYGAPGFEPEDLRAELEQIGREAEVLGAHPAGRLLRRRCREYARVTDLLAVRGTLEFGRISAELYGSTRVSVGADEETRLGDLPLWMAGLIDRLEESDTLPESEKRWDASQGAEILDRRLAESFGVTGPDARVLVSDGIVADAAAGADYVKLRAGARFSDRDLRLLEVHEGWVHLGTNHNASLQPVCRFLRKGAPSATVTQEGLAVLMEILTFSSHTSRLRRLADRVSAIHQIEQGADFVDVTRALREQGLSLRQAYVTAHRAFRGSLPSGALPFTKDLSYTRGFLEVFNFVRLAVGAAQLQRIPLLFCGKTTLRDLPLLDELVDEGLLEQPAFLPPQIADLHGLAAWMCFSNFLNRVALAELGPAFSDVLAE